MPAFYPEGNTALPSDDAMRSLHKIISLGGGGSGSGSGSVFSGNYGGAAPTQTPTTTSAVGYDLDSPFPVWYWNGSSWF